MRLLTVPAVCATLSVGKTKVWQLIQSEQLRAVRIGRAVRIPEDEVNQYVQRLKRMPANDPTNHE